MKNQLPAIERTDLEIYLTELLKKVDMKLGGSEIAELVTISQVLHKWNRAHNLTGHDAEKKIILDLIVDSLFLNQFVQSSSLLDIGSGAGFPGLVLAAVNKTMSVTTLESKGKKISFQKQVVASLGWKGRVFPRQGRAGTDNLDGKQFLAITLRAVTGLEASMQLARPYMAPGGRIILPRGSKDRDQAERMGLEVAREYRLPGKDEARIVVIGEG